MALSGRLRLLAAAALFGAFALTECRRVEMLGPDDQALNQDLLADSELLELAQNPTPHECQEHLVSRRRRAGGMCSCRRRHGHSGLLPGWRCNTSADRIFFVGLDDPERDTVCCCKPGACSMESIRRGSVIEHADPETGGLRCCKIKERGMWGRLTDRCPAWSAYGELVTDSFCDVRQMVSTVEACTEKVTAWLRNPNWYKALINWEDFEPEYKPYLPCGVTKEHHVNRVMLDKDWNGILSLAQPNPIRLSIMRRLECVGLNDAEFEEVVERSHSQVCSWYPPQEWYRPQLQPTSTCNFDDEERRLVLHPDRSCPEGHRCACPVYSGRGTALGSSDFYSLPSTIARYGVMAVTYTAVYGPIVGVTIVSSTMIASPLISAVSPIVGVVAFGAAYVYRTMHFSCSRQAGCFPMDCVHVSHGEHQGCRIRPIEELEDQRNPFWFMPPPNYKCAFNYGGCSMQECSRPNKMRQSVGLVNATRRLSRMRWSEADISTVHNCQPLLHKDMTSEQKSAFETRTQRITAETRAYLEDRRRLAESVERQCPWKRPLTSNYRLQCNDGTSCTAFLAENCCNSHRGIAKCPRNRPYMCADDDECDSVDNACQGRGGLKPCDAERLCPWLVPLVEPEDQSSLVTCGDANGLSCVEYEENVRIVQSGGPYDVSTCHDECGWRDAQNFTCSIYASSNRWCSKYGRGFESGGHTANTACCACGNRSWIGTQSSDANEMRGYRRESGYFLGGYAETGRTERDLVDAVARCDEMRAQCAGVTCTSSSSCTLRWQGDVQCAADRGTFSYVKERRRGGDCCREERQMMRCPAHKPVMCNDKTCGGTHCCATSIEGCGENFGGPRICEFSQFDDVSGLGVATGGGEEFQWAVGNRAMDMSHGPGRCGTLIAAAVGTADPNPFRIEYDDGTESERLSEAQLGRDESCARQDEGTDEADEPEPADEEEEDDEGEPSEPEPARESAGEPEN